MTPNTLGNILVNHPPHDTTWETDSGVSWTFIEKGLQSFFPLGEAGWIVVELGSPTRYYQYNDLPAMSEEDKEQEVKRVR